MFHILKIIFLCLISFIFSSTIYVPEDFETVQEAVDNAIHSDSIFVNFGEYFECVDIEEKSISIFGSSEQNPKIYCAEEYEFAFQMMNFYQQYSVLISDFILSGNGIGGALKFNDTDLELKNIECENFKQTAIYLTNSQLNAENIISIIPPFQFFYFKIYEISCSSNKFPFFSEQLLS